MGVRDKEGIEEIIENPEDLGEDEGEEIDQDNGKTTLEDWMKDGTEEENEDSSDDSEKEEGDNPKPEKTLKAKKKLQRKLKEADDEKEALKAEIEKLKQSKAAPASKPAGKPVRPKELDFNSEEEYEAALDQYDIDIVDYRLSERSAKKEATKTQEAQAVQIKEGVDSHFERAEALLETSGIAPEKYNASNVAVREAIDSIAPGKGDFIADYFISQLGVGSEKVFYNLGVNKAAQAEFINLLTKDPSGVQAGIFLGQKKEQLTNPKKRTTNARPPASSVKGDAPTSAKGGALKRAFDKAVKADNAQAMYNAKKEARAAGVDVSKW